MLNKYKVRLPGGSVVTYDDYNAAKRHTQIICRGTIRTPQLTISKWMGNQWVDETVEIEP